MIATGANAQKTHRLHLLVQFVLLHGRETVEAWYRLPDLERFYTWQEWLPFLDAFRNFLRSGQYCPAAHWRTD